MYVRDVEIDKYVEGKTEKYSRQDFIIREGQPFKKVYYIRKGIVKILKKDGNGKNLLMCFITKGDMIGITTYFNDDKYQFSTQAMTNCEMFSIDAEDFGELLKEHNELNKRMMEVLILRIHFLENWMTNVLNLSMDKRIAEALIYHSLANSNIERDVEENNDILVNYSIDEMAGLAASTPGYIIKILQRFSKMNLIQRVNAEKLLITDYAGILAIANSTNRQVDYSQTEVS